MVFHSKAAERPKSYIESSVKVPQPRKKSGSMEMLTTGGRNSRADENFNFVQEEIAPGKEFEIIANFHPGANEFNVMLAGIIVEGYVADL